jgi:hypothetical protein
MCTSQEGSEDVLVLVAIVSIWNLAAMGIHGGVEEGLAGHDKEVMRRREHGRERRIVRERYCAHRHRNASEPERLTQA